MSDEIKDTGSEPMTPEQQRSIGKKLLEGFGIEASEQEQPEAEASTPAIPPDDPWHHNGFAGDDDGMEDESPRFDLSDDSEPDMEADDESEADDEEWTYTEPEAEQVDEPAELSDSDRALLEERRKRIKAERQLHWLQDQALETRRSNWCERDSKFFPYLSKEAVREIANQATSRRQFAKLARAQNEQVKKVAAPIIERELEKQRVDRKVALKAAWGSPVAGSGVPAGAARVESAVRKALDDRDLVAAARIRLFGVEK